MQLFTPKSPTFDSAEVVLMRQRPREVSYQNQRDSNEIHLNPLALLHHRSIADELLVHFENRV